jgi:hypothetical protein
MEWSQAERRLRQGEKKERGEESRRRRWESARRRRRNILGKREVRRIFLSKRRSLDRDGGEVQIMWGNGRRRRWKIISRE